MVGTAIVEEDAAVEVVGAALVTDAGVAVLVTGTAVGAGAAVLDAGLKSVWLGTGSAVLIGAAVVAAGSSNSQEVSRGSNMGRIDVCLLDDNR